MAKIILDKTIEMDRNNFIKKHGLIHENNAWYYHRENSHKHLIFKDTFYEKSDIIGLLFRFNKLCTGKEKYFRKNMKEYEPCKYHYKEGFIIVPLWDADFLRHKASGFILDFNYLQTITVYDDFVSLCIELEGYELINNIDKIHTTEMGIIRIKRNLELETDDVVNLCKREIMKSNDIYKRGKNWYVSAKDFIITINIHSYTIITAHKKD